MPEQRGSAVEKPWFFGKAPKTQQGYHTPTTLPLCYACVYIIVYINRCVPLRTSLAGRLEGPHVVPVSCVLSVGSHRAASSSHSACLAFFLWEWWRTFFVVSALHWSLLRSQAGLKIYCPSAWCKGNSPVLSHTDPDEAGGVGNSVLRSCHKKC